MIFVMGATGQVARATIDSLLEQGVPPAEIAAGARSVAKARDLSDLGVTVRAADYNDRSLLEQAFQSVETLVLIPTKTPAGPRCVEHWNALEAAKAAGVKRVVFLSLQASTPQSRFSVDPFIMFAESATRLAGLRWTFARMSLYTDPVAEWAPELVRTGVLPYPVKDARIAYVARQDVGRSLAAVARRTGLNGEIVEFTGPAALSMPELAGAISEVYGVTVQFHTITEDEYRELCRKDHLPEEITEILVTMYHAAEAQEFSNVTADIERLTGKAAESVIETLRRQAKQMGA